MAGNTNLAYRRLCRRFGVELTTTEMVSAQALHFNDEKSLGYLERGDDEEPVAAQVFGAQPEILADAARKIEERGFHIVDLNVGCPVPKITGGGGGSALLREPELAAECIRAMDEATSIPVTIKIRAGWDDERKNAPEFAARMQEAGARTVTVHGRTREQKYTGHADLELIRRVVEAVDIPVIGNGDVVDVESAQRMAATGVKGIAVGRGALGKPWVFAQIRASLRGEAIPAAPDAAEANGAACGSCGAWPPTSSTASPAPLRRGRPAAAWKPSPTWKRWPTPCAPASRASCPVPNLGGRRPGRPAPDLCRPS